LANELPKMEKDPVLKKKFPKPIGGICSLLYFLTVTLKATLGALEELAYLNSQTPGQELLSSRSAAHKKRSPVSNGNMLALGTVSGLGLGGAGAWILTGGRGGSTSAPIEGTHRSLAIAACVTGAWIGSMSTLKLMWYDRRKRLARAQLVQCNASLTTLLKLLILVMNIVDVEAVRRNNS
jgi:hypothetical protein